MRRELSSDRIRFRSIEEDEIKTIHKHQNTDCIDDISNMLEFDLPWAPATLDHIKSKIGEIRKKDHTTLFAIFSKDDEFIGMAIFGASWDTWSPYIHVLIWPEHRRKGFGTEAANLLLEASFNRSLAHVTCCSVSDYNKEGLAFAESLGFKNQGAERRVGMMDEEFFDQVYLDILREEYLAMRSEGGGA